MLPLLWDMAELDYDPVDAFVDVGELLAEGTSSLEPMAVGLGVRFAAVVARVAHHPAGVTATLEDGTSVDAGLTLVGGIAAFHARIAPRRRCGTARSALSGCHAPDARSVPVMEYRHGRVTAR
jgi:hypothetical protein